MILQNPQLLLMGGISHGDAHEKAVKLGLRQGIGPRRLHRILRGQHHKGGGRGIGVSIDGHLVFLHHLQQGGLGFGAGPVDFVRQYDLVHNAALVQLLLPGFQVEHGETGDIRRKHVGGELNTPEAAAQRGGQRRRQRRLAQAGHILDEHMPRANHGYQHEIDDVVLADDHLPDIVPDTA